MTSPVPTVFTSAVAAWLTRCGYASANPRAALIDMDGTLYDSMKNHTAAWHRLMTENGVDCTRDEFYLYEGRTGASTIDEMFKRQFRRHATDGEKERLYHLKTLYFRELPEVERMPGALEMVTAFAALGLKRVLVTGSGQNSLISRIPADFPGLFSDELRITSRNVEHGKPHPEPFLKAMQLAGVTPRESVVVENAPLGIRAGHDSGAFTVGVVTGPIPREAFEEARADIIFPSMPEFAANVPLLVTTLKQTRL